MEGGEETMLLVTYCAYLSIDVYLHTYIYSGLKIHACVKNEKCVCSTRMY